MQLIYEGKDITGVVDIQSADIVGNAGGNSDSLDIRFNDTKGIWSRWKPQKNHTLQFTSNGLTSGLMYVDEIKQQRGIFTIRALSIPQKAKTENTKAWENVRFLEFAQEMATKNGFTLKTYGIENNLYKRIDQYEKADFEFLDSRCKLEGCILKLFNKNAIIYKEKYMEDQAYVKTIYIDQFDGPFEFTSKSTGIYGSSRLSYNDIKYEYNPGLLGPMLKITDVTVDNLAEAERYTKNLLRLENKTENTGYFTINIDVSISAGSTINVSGVGMADGRYIITQSVHKIVSKKTFLRVRKPLGGY